MLQVILLFKFYNVNKLILYNDLSLRKKMFVLIFNHCFKYCPINSSFSKPKNKKENTSKFDES